MATKSGPLFSTGKKIRGPEAPARPFWDPWPPPASEKYVRP